MPSVCPTCARSMERLRDRTYACPACQTELFERRPETPRRSFAACLFLGVVTLGVYFVYYNFIVFREVDKAAGRRHWGVLFIAGVTLGAAAVGLGYTGLEPMARVLAWAANGATALYLYLEVAAFPRPERPLPPVILPALVIAGAVLTASDLGMGVHFVFLLVYLATYFFLHQGIQAWWTRRTEGPAHAAMPNTTSQS